MSTEHRLIHCNPWLAVSCGLALLITTPVYAQYHRVVKVEEHWELQLGQPDTESSAPQITMVMSPVAGLDDSYFLFTLNHHTDPNYGAGGMQVQRWSGDELSDSRLGNEEGALSQDQEVVTWVQQISVEDGYLKFRVHDGASQTWGSFGGDDLSLSVPTTLQNLNHYRPGTSIAETQVGYAENRVGSLVLTKLVWVTEDGTVYVQNAPIPVDMSLPSE
jgi:hypothetical protein